MPRSTKKVDTPTKDIKDEQTTKPKVSKKKNNVSKTEQPKSSKLVKGSEESKARIAELRAIKAQKKSQQAQE